jgi:hypothetical protein
MWIRRGPVCNHFDADLAVLRDIPQDEPFHPHSLMGKAEILSSVYVC